MTTYTLNFWSKNCGSVQIERVYVNAADRSSLGFFEMRIGTAERGADSYYDAHRRAKGDTVIETGRTYTTTLPAEAVQAIYSAPSIAASIEAQKIGDDFSRFYALKEHARGISWLAGSPAQKKALKAKAAFTIEL